MNQEARKRIERGPNRSCPKCHDDIGTIFKEGKIYFPEHKDHFGKEPWPVCAGSNTEAPNGEFDGISLARLLWP